MKEIELKPITEHTPENEQADFKKEYGFYIDNNCYVFMVGTGNKRYPEKISNFTIKVHYSLSDGKTGNYIMQLTNNKGQTKIFDISNKEFVSIPDFQARIEPDFLFSGNKANLYAVKQYIFQGLTIAEEIKILGYNKVNDFYAFSNGILNKAGDLLPVDEYGIVSIKGKNFYLPAFSKITESETERYTNDRKFYFKAGEMNMKQFSGLINQAYGFNGIAYLLWACTAINSDIVFNTTGFFPFPFHFGVKGTGKSQITDIFQTIWGEPRQPLQLEGGSTDKSIFRGCTQFCNAIIILEEYTNNISDKMIGFLKTAYNRVGIASAQFSNDNRINQNSINSGITITGNEIPTRNSPLFDRMILLRYSKGTEHNKFTKKENEAYETLKKAREKGLGNILKTIWVCRDTIKKNYSESYANYRFSLKYDTFKNVEISDRTLNNIASILAYYGILINDCKIDFDFEVDEFLENLIDNIHNQNEIIKNVSEVKGFWKAIEYLIQNNKIQNDKHYRYNAIVSSNTLYIRYEAIYPFYKRFCVEHQQNSIDMESLRLILTSSSAFLPSDNKKTDTHIMKFKGEGNNTRSAYAFDINILGINLSTSTEGNF